MKSDRQTMEYQVTFKHEDLQHAIMDGGRQRNRWIHTGNELEWVF